MNFTVALPAILLQSSAQSVDFARDHHLLMIFIGMVAMALLIQALCVMGVTVGLFFTLKQGKELVHETHAAVNELLKKTDRAVSSISPKLESIAGNSEAISLTVREKVEELGETVSSLARTVEDVNLRARQQIAHADRIVGSTLTTTEEVRDTLVEGVRVPVRQIAGMLAGLKAGLATLMERSPFGRG
jgi:methyl-accepting chemotaxis protein